MTKQTIQFTPQEQKWAGSLDLDFNLTWTDFVPNWLRTVVSSNSSAQNLQVSANLTATQRNCSVPC